MTPEEIRRAIVDAPGETLHESSAHACYATLLAAQEAGAPGPELVAIIWAFRREWKALEAVVDELGV
ncbi:hypothetical protein [Agromyces mariniharenae]|uniref:Uncharacterized protein n=1 Tax=Agromyces mariniharenae TaxID=2604423 RepID=A0A5S4V3E7_9MICO|nr:hypothetical protein [Agromyces mariniharenae]TYL51040.1 hypothetical protein FYC51_18080 [Agromyces mariniharenae]